MARAVDYRWKRGWRPAHHTLHSRLNRVRQFNSERMSENKNSGAIPKQQNCKSDCYPKNPSNSHNAVKHGYREIISTIHGTAPSMRGRCRDPIIGPHNGTVGTRRTSKRNRRAAKANARNIGRHVLRNQLKLTTLRGAKVISVLHELAGNGGYIAKNPGRVCCGRVVSIAAYVHRFGTGATSQCQGQYRQRKCVFHLPLRSGDRGVQKPQLARLRAALGFRPEHTCTPPRPCR